MARESCIVNQHLSGRQVHGRILGRASIGWYLWVGWYIPPGRQPLVFIQKVVLAGTVSPEMKYSAFDIVGTEPQHRKCLKHSGLSVGMAWRTTPLPNLSLSNVVLLECFKSVIFFRIFSPCATPRHSSIYLNSSEENLSSGTYPWIPNHFYLNQVTFLSESSFLSSGRHRCPRMAEPCQGPCCVWTLACLCLFTSWRHPLCPMAYCSPAPGLVKAWVRQSVLMARPSCLLPFMRANRSEAQAWQTQSVWLPGPGGRKRLPAITGN